MILPLVRLAPTPASMKAFGLSGRGNILLRLNRNLVLGAAVFVVVEVAAAVAYVLSENPVAGIVAALGVGFALTLGFGRAWHREIVQTMTEQTTRLAAVNTLVSAGRKLPLYWSGWAIPPETLCLILHLMERLQVSCVLELGSGISTVFIAETLKQRGRGKLVSLEHEQQWAATTTKDLADRGLDEIAKVTVAPLTPQDVAEETFCWYELPEAIRQSKFDLIIVDGPPIKFGVPAHARLPALYELRNLLTSTGVLLLDDANRIGETEVMKRWQDDFPDLKFRKLAVGHGLLVVSRTSAVFDLLPQ